MKLLLFLLLFLPAGILLSAQTAIPGQQKRDSLILIHIDTVEIWGNKFTRRNSIYRITSKEAKSIVTVLGETDVMRYMGTLPGVSPGMEGGLGYFVRGSNSGNNRTALDNAPVYGNSHLFGLFSIFNSETVESVTFNTGKMPTEYGDFASSLMRVNSAVPGLQQYNSNISVSPFMAGAAVSGPIVRNKLSVQVAARMSLINTEYALIRALFNAETVLDLQVADLYVKLFYNLHARHKLWASSYMSNDYLGYKNEPENSDEEGNHIEVNWSNSVQQLVWDWNISDNLQLKTFAYCNRFVSMQRQRFYDYRDNLRSDLRLRSSLNEWAAQSAVLYSSGNFNLHAGVQAKWQKFRPASEKVIISSKDNYTFNEPYQSGTFTVFTEARHTIGNFSYSAGLRASLYSTETHSISDYSPRLGLSLLLSPNAGIEISYDRMSQFHHVLEGLPIGWSLDLMVPANENYKPEQTDQLYAGGYLGRKGLLLSGGVFYRKMKNLASYRNAVNIFGVQNSNWMDEITMGDGASYGLELRGEISRKQWNATVSYTLSKSDRVFDDINDGRKFPAKFDRRHVANVNGQITTRVKNNKTQLLNISVAISSGHHITIPVGMYQGVVPPYFDQRNTGYYISQQALENIYYRQMLTPVNGFHMPLYLRADIGYSFIKKRGRTVRDLTIGLFNITNNHNPYLVFYKDGRWQQLSMLPILPSIRWSLSF